MTLLVPDHSLNVPREELANFLINFARFEYAVKASGYSKNTNGYAVPDWNSYCKSIKTNFTANPSAELKLHVKYITRKPPKQLVKQPSGTLKWVTRPPKATWKSLRIMLFFAQGVRNNVTHGSKFTSRESSELNRNKKLMAAATAIISAFLDHSAKTREVFNGFAP